MIFFKDKRLLKISFGFFLFILIQSIDLSFFSLSWAQTNVLTNSGNTKNQFHRNLMGQCSATSVLCGPNTASPGAGAVNGPQSTQRVDAVAPGEIRCVSGFGTADGNRAGGVPTSDNDLCMTTAGILWAGDQRTMSGNNVAFDNNNWPFTGLPRIPTGADTQFGVGAKATNRLDIGGTANDSFIPAGSSIGNFSFSVRHDFTDSLNGDPGGFGGFGGCGNIASGCQTASKITWSAPKPSNCPTSGTGAICPNATLNGNFFESVNVPCPVGVTGPCREHRMRYGFTQRFVGGTSGNEGSTGTNNDGNGMQEFIASYSVVSQTNGNGDLISNPTGFYFNEIACIAGGSSSFTDCADTGEANINATTNRFVGSSETGSFNTAVTFPSGVPTVSVTLTQSGGSTGSGCQHDSNGTTCINRSSSFLP